MEQSRNSQSSSHLIGRVACVFAVALLFVALTGASAAAGTPVIEQDRVRIQAHLQEVEQDLRSKDVSHLSPELQAEREQNLDRLNEYWKAGIFPHNTHVPWRQPVFIDRDGRACAVGYLMIESGWEGEAEEISERENLAYLPNMESPAVGEWVAQSGLTAEEAARIQPSYSDCASGCSCDVDPVCGKDGKTYINLCFAQACGGIDEYRDGCCMPDDEIESVYSDGYGTFPQNCPSDPNNNSAQHCPEGSSDAGGDVGDDVWQRAPEPEDEKKGCSSTDGSPQSLWMVALVALGCLARRRAVDCK